MNIDLHVQSRYSCQILIRLEKICRNIFEKFSNIIFQENPPSGKRAVAFRQSGGQS